MQRMIRNPGARLFGMDCACGSARPFVVTPAAVVCEDCGQSRACAPPVIGVDERACDCGPSRTFILDIAGAYTCTACGHVIRAETPELTS